MTVASREETHGSAVVACHLDTNWGLISSGWVTWMRVYDVERPETPNDSRNITDDVSGCIIKCISTLLGKASLMLRLHIKKKKKKKTDNKLD